ncbi:MAG: hypothetical protein DWQ10_04855 [Calditrichaeota bacterium]|nr:MAG: hypothetical protein DWQ10_04855 [Calditrichota bacterium]
MRLKLVFACQSHKKAEENMVNKIKFLMISLFLFLFGYASLWAQVEFDQRFNTFLPSFYIDFNATRAENGLDRVTMYAKVPFDELQFLKSDDGGFKASYEMSITIFDDEDFQVDGVIFERNITVSEYEQTNATDVYDVVKRSFKIQPGKYKFYVQLEDLDTHKIGVSEHKIELEDYSNKDLSISSILFSEKVEVDSTGKLVPVPLVGVPRKETGNLYGFFTIYAPEDGDFKVEVIVRNMRNKVLYKDKKKIKRDGFETPIAIAIPDAKLSLGTYNFQVKVDQGDHDTSLRENFKIYWEGLPLTAVDLETAIDQMDLIANPKDLKTIRDAPPEKQRDYFRQFWKQYDPTAGTKKNELMAEYYRRIQYANDNFRGLREGWKTDMGTVYILLGAPEEVVRNMSPQYMTSYYSSRPVKALQIWKYHTLNRYFLFIDENGFGDYRLDNPSVLAEFRNTFRY